MKINLKKIMRKLHLWISIPLGLLITLICFSGATLIFEKEITELIYHDVVFISPQAGDEPHALDEVLRALDGQTPADRSVTGITVYPDKTRAYKVSLSGEGRAALYVDPYTLQVTGEYVRPAFFDTMFRMHRRMLGPIRGEGSEWGKSVVGISTWALVVILITGIIIWVPRYRKTYKNRLTISVTKGGHHFLRGLHLAGGIYAALLLLLMALTGLTWTYEWYNRSVYSLLGVEAPQRKEGKHHHSRSASKETETQATPTDYALWQMAYSAVAPQEMGAQEISVGDDLEVRALRPVGINARATNRYRFDATTQTIAETTLYQDTPTESRLRSIFYSLHVGQWGGITTRILAFLVALLGATLPLTGYYIWIRRRFFPRPKRCVHGTQSAQ